MNLKVEEKLKARYADDLWYVLIFLILCNFYRSRLREVIERYIRKNWRRIWKILE